MGYGVSEVVTFLDPRQVWTGWSLPKYRSFLISWLMPIAVTILSHGLAYVDVKLTGCRSRFYFWCAVEIKALTFFASGEKAYVGKFLVWLFSLGSIRTIRRLLWVIVSFKFNHSLTSSGTSLLIANYSFSSFFFSALSSTSTCLISGSSISSAS